MKIFLITLALALMSVMPFAYAQDNTMNKTTDNTMHENSKISAVVFYADSCGACKILDPKMKEALNSLNQDKIDVVKFDFSNRNAIEQTKALAVEKNLTGTLQSYGAKTGFVVLVNQTGEIVETIHARDTANEIVSKIEQALAQDS